MNQKIRKSKDFYDDLKWNETLNDLHDLNKNISAL